MKNWKVGTKLIAVLVAPLLVLAVLAGVGINERLTEASDAQRAEDLSELAATSSTLVHELQLEAVFSAAHMASDGTAVGEELDEQRQNTAAAITELRETLDGFDAAGESESFQNTIGTAGTRLDDLDTIRAAVSGGQMSVYNATTQLIETAQALLDLNQEVALAAKTPELASSLENYAEYSRRKQDVAVSAALLAAVVERTTEPGPSFRDGNGTACTDVDECQEYVTYVAALATERERQRRWEERATPDQKSLDRNATSSPEVRVADEMLAEAELAGAQISEDDPGLVTGIEPTEWLTGAQEKLVALLAVENGLVTQIVNEANDLRNSAESQWRTFLLITIVAILVATVLALLVARATARPLQKLTGAANRLSTDQLPALVEQLRNPQDEREGSEQEVTPIDIDSKDEIGQLADAINTIQQVTVDVAEEQAALLHKGIADIFVNLARRNQTLLDRQIEFIDQLEANEEDPDQLDNLFKLDHLATRMRRNAESLLVLAGAEPPRRRGRPVALADVVRVAIGEVEDFARISLLALDEAMVGGNVAVDLAHLLSELMENATHFSPPDTHVEVVGRAEPDGSFTLTITDQGIGMSGEQLAEANEQLENPPLVGLALSRSLGFIVIGRLAQRFGIGVELQSSPSGGISADVCLPREIVTDEDGNPLPIDESVAAALAAEEEPALLEADTEEAEPEPTATLVEPEEAEDVEAEPEPAVVSEEAEPSLVEPEEAEDVEAEPEPAVVSEEAEAEPEDYEIVEEVVVEYDEGELEPEDYEIVEEVVVEYDEEPATFEEAVPEGDAFERGLESLISGETAPGPTEEVPVLEPEPEAEPDQALEPEPVVAQAEERVALPLDDRPPAAPPPTGSEITAAGLVKRTPKKQAASTVGGGPLRTASTISRPTSGHSHRSPEEVRKMLSRYRGGLKRGRQGGDEPSSGA